MKAVLQQPVKSNSFNNALKPKEEPRNKNEAFTEPAVLNTAGPSFDFGNIPIYQPPAYVQTKLTVNSPGDEYEQEADAVRPAFRIPVIRQRTPASLGS